MSMLGFFKGNGKSGFGYDSTTTDVTAGLDLTDRTILVTGCNAGLGQETLRALCARRARVIGAARTFDKATAACALVSGKALPVACDLSGEKGYAAWSAYGQSKLANLLFARHLAMRLPKPEQTANAVHPGVIATNLQRHLSAGARVAFSVIEPLLLKNVAQGAATPCYVAVHPAAASIRGEYFANCNVAQASKHAQDTALAEKLWEKTEEIVATLRAVR